MSMIVQSGRWRAKAATASAPSLHSANSAATRLSVPHNSRLISGWSSTSIIFVWLGERGGPSVFGLHGRVVNSDNERRAFEYAGTRLVRFQLFTFTKTFT
jgi:hypothetical protein